MRIGPEQWHWVSIDTAGVPTGGVYGDVRRVAEKIAKHGGKRAWAASWGHFVMYEVRADGVHVPHLHFTDWVGQPIPVRDDHIRVFLWLREQYASQPTIELAMKQHDAKLKYEKEIELQRQREERREALIHATDLDLGLITPREMIVVP